MLVVNPIEGIKMVALGKKSIDYREDDMSTEKKALNEIERFFEDSKVVDTFLSRNDKEPMWDGNLYLYNGKGQTNKSFVGRVAAQVKGKNVKAIRTDKAEISYPIETTSLRAYLSEGTVFYVVQLCGEERKIYRRFLTPVLIRSILRVHKGQTASVKMEASEGLTAEEDNLLQFKMDCKKQVSYADQPTLNFEDLAKNGISSFSVNITQQNPIKSFFDSVTSKPVYIYGNTGPGGTAQIPIGDGPVMMTLMQNVHQPVSVGGKVYYDSYKNELGEKTVTIKIGHSFKLTIDKEAVDGSRHAQINVRHEMKMLKDAIRDGEFIVALDKARKVKIGDFVLDIPKNDLDMSDGMEKAVKAWKKLDEILQMLGANKDLNMSLLKKKDSKTIDLLIEMIKEGKAVALKKADTEIVNLRLGNLHLWLLCCKVDDKNFRLFNFFDKSQEIKVSYKYPDGEFDESIFGRFDKNWYVECDNIPFQEIKDSYAALIGRNPHVYERATMVQLELLKAYDMMDGKDAKRQLAYDAAVELNEWLVGNDNNQEERVSNVLNGYQIKKRKDNLREKDMAELKRIQLENSANNVVGCGVSLLLGEKASFDFYWSKLSSDEQKTFKEYPIWKFYQELK